MAGETSFKRSLGIFELVSLGVGGTNGSGIFGVPGIAAHLTGSASLDAWIIIAISASCVLLSLAALFSRPTRTGSFYSLFESVFGSRVAAPIVILYIISAIPGYRRSRPESGST